MKILTDFVTKVEGDTVTITAKIVEGGVPLPAQQHTALHFDNETKNHISHIQMSNHGFFIRKPSSNVGIAIPAEQWISKVARVVEPELNPTAKPKNVAK